MYVYINAYIHVCMVLSPFWRCNDYHCRNGQGKLSSNPGQDCLHVTEH